MKSTRLKAFRGRMLAICLMLSIPAVEACGVLFDPSHGSITGTWVRRFPNEEPVTSWPFPPRWTLRVTETSDGAVTGTIMKETFSDPTPPPELRRPPQVWTVEGSRRGAKVRLDFKDNGAVRQYFEGKQVDQNVIEGSVSPREGSEHRVMVEFERRH